MGLYVYLGAIKWYTNPYVSFFYNFVCCRFERKRRDNSTINCVSKTPEAYLTVY